MLTESTLIIGNGFDLDLGLKTTFRHFAESEFWPVTKEIQFFSQLASFLEQHRQVDTWFDIERLLAEYAVPIKNPQESAKAYLFGSHSSDKEFFNKLQKKLCEYIRQQEESILDKSSLAFALLKLVSELGMDNIFSFNYTDMHQYCEANNLRPFNYMHVHGSCANNDAILGISDDFSVREKCEYLYKTSSPYYRSSNVRYALQKSQLVVFFGHSLGPQDYHYFRDFFSQQSQSDLKEDSKRDIIIITRDETSRMNIISQLRRMNEGRMNLLYDCNNLSFYKSAENDKTDILKDIKNRIERLHKHGILQSSLV